MRNILLICMMLLALSVKALAQENNIVVKGVVTDITNKEPMIGVNVSIAEMPDLALSQTLMADFLLKCRLYHKLVFSYIGYDKVEVLVKEQRTVNVVMKEADASIIDEVVVTGIGTQKRKIAVTGAITNVDVEELKYSPSASVADALAGVVPGIQAMQTDGRPGICIRVLGA